MKHTEPVIASDTLSINQTAQLLGISRGSVFNLRKDATRNFPREVPMSMRNKRYYRADIEAYAKHGANWQIAQLR